jgi:hypothetical protein
MLPRRLKDKIRYGCALSRARSRSRSSARRCLLTAAPVRSSVAAWVEPVGSPDPTCLKSASEPGEFGETGRRRRATGLTWTVGEAGRERRGEGERESERRGKPNGSCTGPAGSDANEVGTDATDADVPHDASLSTDDKLEEEAFDSERR